MRTLVICFCLIQTALIAQVADDFSDGNFTSYPAWIGDTSLFTINYGSAIPPEMKPALQLDAVGSDTAILYLPNVLIQNTQWLWWLKLSFNTSANNFARIYLVSDQADLSDSLNGYFIQVGGADDSVGLYRQTGTNIEKLLTVDMAYTGNSSNVLRIKVLHFADGLWQIFTDPSGGYDFQDGGSVFDAGFSQTVCFGIFCKFTSSNATKFYFDDFIVGEIVIDTLPPEINSVLTAAPNRLDVIFNETVELVSAQDVEHYFVNQGSGNPLSAQRDAADFTKVRLEFGQSFTPGVSYKLYVSGIADLSGNISLGDSVNFVLEVPVVVNPSDVLINEIMADISPPPDGLPEAEYIELYNRTGWPVNLVGFTLQLSESEEPAEMAPVIIHPDSFLIVTSASNVEHFEPFGQVTSVSGFSLNNEGMLALRNTSGNMIHAVSYSSDLYDDEEKQEGGWALEQIDPQYPCSLGENWTVAVAVAGGTPGFQNSVDLSNILIPDILFIETLNEHRLKIEFTHSMDSLLLTNPDAYFVDQGIGNAISASSDQFLFNAVEIEFTESFTENIVYHLQLTDTITDCTGNPVNTENVYWFVKPAEAFPFDVVINEIMADPAPSVGLPEYEYLEIFNTTDRFISVKNWKLLIGTTEKMIPDMIIYPQEYICFTDDEILNLFSMFCRTLGFSSLGLSNSGSIVKLLNQNGELMSGVDYSDSWYRDDTKAEGGWSLEQIDPDNPCHGEFNWKVSIAEEGGTPGQLNSVNSVNQINPMVQKAIVTGEKLLEVSFNQFMNRNVIEIPDMFEVDHGMGNPAEIFWIDSSFFTAGLVFADGFLPKTVYTLSVHGQFENCKGEAYQVDQFLEFGKHEAALQEDLVINEILFNPSGDGADFVEIYNRSEKIINLMSLKLGNIEKEAMGLNDTVYKSVSSDDQLFLPGQYLVLSPDPGKVKEQYFTENENGFITMTVFPQFSNEAGSVVIASGEDVVVDVFHYSDEMHYPLLRTTEGVSLEKIHYNRPSSDPTNWHSASQTAGFATPAYVNSQFSESGSVGDPVSLEPEIFSPDNDGFEDNLLINYNFDTPGYTTNISIYDDRGRLVRRLVENTMLGTEGSFTWDGITENNKKAGIGIYLVFIEVFDTRGMVQKFKKTTVLAGKIGH
jgi:hypothetical protein